MSKKFSQEEVNKLKSFIKGKDVPFFFIPSSNLREMISRNEHPYIKKLPDIVKSIYLSGRGYLIHQDTVVKYMEGTLDIKNTFIFDNGEIRIHNDINSITRKGNNGQAN